MLKSENMSEAARNALIHSGIDDGNEDDILAHYGVEGMKWGRRKQDRAERKAGGGRITPFLSVNKKPVLSVVKRTSPAAHVISGIKNKAEQRKADAVLAEGNTQTKYNNAKKDFGRAGANRVNLDIRSGVSSTKARNMERSRRSQQAGKAILAGTGAAIGANVLVRTLHSVHRTKTGVKFVAKLFGANTRGAQVWAAADYTLAAVTQNPIGRTLMTYGASMVAGTLAVNQGAAAAFKKEQKLKETQGA